MFEKILEEFGQMILILVMGIANAFLSAKRKPTKEEIQQRKIDKNKRVVEKLILKTEKKRDKLNKLKSEVKQSA